MRARRGAWLQAAADGGITGVLISLVTAAHALGRGEHVQPAPVPRAVALRARAVRATRARLPDGTPLPRRAPGVAWCDADLCLTRPPPGRHGTSSAWVSVSCLIPRRTARADRGATRPAHTRCIHRVDCCARRRADGWPATGGAERAVTSLWLSCVRTPSALTGTGNEKKQNSRRTAMLDGWLVRLPKLPRNVKQRKAARGVRVWRVRNAGRN